MFKILSAPLRGIAVERKVFLKSHNSKRLTRINQNYGKNVGLKLPNLGKLKSQATCRKSRNGRKNKVKS